MQWTRIKGTQGSQDSWQALQSRSSDQLISLTEPLPWGWLFVLEFWFTACKSLKKYLSTNKWCVTYLISLRGWRGKDKTNEDVLFIVYIFYLSKTYLYCFPSSHVPLFYPRFTASILNIDILDTYIHVHTSCWVCSVLPACMFLGLTTWH